MYDRREFIRLIMPWHCMRNSVRITILVLLALGAAPASSAECFDRAAQRYNRGKATLVAPKNRATLTINGKSYSCQIQRIALHDYEAVVTCNNKMKFHIGETARCDPSQSGPQCDGMIIGVKGPGIKEKTVLSPATKAVKRCLNNGAQLEITNKFSLNGLGAASITTYNIFAP